MTRNTERWWGAETRLDGQNARDRLMDIAEQCYLAFGVDRTSIADIARTAGLSRQAVHGYFGTPANVLNASLRRGLSRLWHAMEDKMNMAPTYPEWLVDGLLFAVDEGRELPSSRLLFLSEVAVPLRNLLLVDHEYLYERSDALAGKFEASYRRREPEGITAPNPLMVVEWFHRQFCSYQTASLFFDRNDIRTALLQSCPAKAPSA